MVACCPTGTAPNRASGGAVVLPSGGAPFLSGNGGVMPLSGVVSRPEMSKPSEAADSIYLADEPHLLRLRWPNSSFYPTLIRSTSPT